MTDTFIRITNREIYEKLESIEAHVIKTNGKVTLNRWIGTSALSMGFLIMGWLGNHLINIGG